MGQFGYLVLATGATVHYFYTVRLLHMQQLHHRLLTVIFFSEVYLPVRIRPIVSGCRKRLRSTLLNADVIVIDSRKSPNSHSPSAPYAAATSSPTYRNFFPEVYLPVRIRPIVSGCRKRLRSTLLNADAIVIDSRKSPNSLFA